MTRDPRTLMWTEACAMLERAERLRRQFFEPLPGAQEARWQPPVDILETDTDLRVIVALPGVTPADVRIASENDTLIVAAVRPLPSLARQSRIHRLEIPHGRFERRIALSSGHVRLERHELVDGCLVLTFAKVARGTER